MISKILAVLGVGAALLWAGNTSLFSSFPEGGGPHVIAHRGVHQTFRSEGLTSETCTAERIDPPTHDFLENTIPSMQAAFAAGADVVELDVHLTPDNHFAVLHDWTLDCRTDGYGVTEETPYATLKTLDVGYGYTADGGKTFPLRGKGVGLMPDLEGVFAAMPDKQFLINFKSRRKDEGETLGSELNENDGWRGQTFGVYGGGEPTDATLAGVGGLKGYTPKSVKTCLFGYLLKGWTGHVPPACRGTFVPVPANFTWLLWGWPERFYDRMHAANSEVILLGPYSKNDPGSTGIDSLEDWQRVPKDFPGYVWTNKIEKARDWAAESGLCGEGNPMAVCRP